MSESTCAVDGCERRALARGWCSPHYQRNKHHGTPEPTGFPPVKPLPNQVCVVEGCERLAGTGTQRMCPMHHKRWREHGDPDYVRVRPKTRGNDTCSIDGCASLVVAMGWCNHHWKRYNDTGDPLAPNPRKRERVCAICHGKYLGTKRRSKTCSEACKKTYKARYARELAAVRRFRNPHPPLVTHQAVCDCCGKIFDANGKRWRYCSRKCFRAYKNRANWKHDLKRRRLMVDAFVEMFDRQEIFVRDGWICQLCHEPIDQAARWPNQMSASVDHIIPITLGGEHSRANVQASHLICNIRKGGRLSA